MCVRCAIGSARASLYRDQGRRTLVHCTIWDMHTRALSRAVHPCKSLCANEMRRIGPRFAHLCMAQTVHFALVRALSTRCAATTYGLGDQVARGLHCRSAVNGRIARPAHLTVMEGPTVEAHATDCACRACLTRAADALLRKGGAETLCLTHPLRPKSRPMRPKAWTRNAGYGRPLTALQSGMRVTLWGLDTGTKRRSETRVRLQDKRTGRTAATPIVQAAQENKHQVSLTRVYPALAYKPGFGG